MVLGFCNSRLSVAWMMLMGVALSNAKRQRSSSAAAAGTCEEKTIESRLSSIEEQLVRIQGIASTLNNPPVKEGCTVDLASYGTNDSTKFGYIKTSGGSSDEVLVLSKPSSNRGVTLMELDATSCMTKNRQLFNTVQNINDRIQLLETMESAEAGTIIIGVTADAIDDKSAFRTIAGPFFTKYNMNIAGLPLHNKFAFLMQKGYPIKTIFESKGPGDPSVRVKIALNGSTVFNVTFSRVEIAKARLY